MGDTAAGVPLDCAPFPVELVDGGSYRWDIQADGQVGSGTDGAYDGGLALILDGVPFPAQVVATRIDPRTIQLGPAGVGDLRVARGIFVPDDDRYARYMETLENPGPGDRTVTVSVQSVLGSGAVTTVLGTSSGDSIPDAGDDWVVTADDGSADVPLFLLHVFSDEFAALQPTTVSAEPAGTLRYDFDVTVPAGGRAVLLHYASRNPFPSAALLQTHALPEAGRGLAGRAEGADIVNFAPRMAGCDVPIRVGVVGGPSYHDVLRQRLDDMGDVEAVRIDAIDAATLADLDVLVVHGGMAATDADTINAWTLAGGGLIGVPRVVGDYGSLDALPVSGPSTGAEAQGTYDVELLVADSPLLDGVDFAANDGVCLLLQAPPIAADPDCVGWEGGVLRGGADLVARFPSSGGVALAWWSFGDGLALYVGLDYVTADSYSAAPHAWGRRLMANAVAIAAGCVDPVAEGTVRLVGGAAATEGRVEIFASGRWGTVCDDYWGDGLGDGIANGDVLCRQLGYPGLATIGAPVLASRVAISLDDVQCVGDEERLLDCPARPLGESDCTSADAVGVRCLLPGTCRADGQCPEGAICLRGVCDTSPSMDLAPGTYRINVNEYGDDGAIPSCVLTVTVRTLRAEGEACDRAGRADTCEGALVCLMTDVDGVGACGAYVPPEYPPAPAPVAEVEPDGTRAEAAVGVVTIPAAVSAHLDVAEVDVFALRLNMEMAVRVFTGDGAGGCPGDTRLYLIDGAVLDASGVDASVALGAWLDFDDDDGAGLCSLLDVVLPAGVHYFLVDEFRRDAAVDYVITFTGLPLAGDGVPCDVLGVQSRCSTGSTRWASTRGFRASTPTSSRRRASTPPRPSPTCSRTTTTPTARRTAAAS